MGVLEGALASRDGRGMLLRIWVWNFSQLQSRPSRVCLTNVLIICLGTLRKVVRDCSVDAPEHTMLLSASSGYVL